jgi:translocator protein
MAKSDWLKLAVCIVLPMLVGLTGGMFTESGPDSWYAGIKKPSFNPPGWIFGPVWTALYLMMGVAAFLIWRKGWELRPVRLAMIFFLIQLLLNGAWSPAFFGLQSPLAGLIIIAFLWVAILLTLISFAALSALAAGLMAPYLFWVSFAAVLNGSIYFLNR